MASNKIGTTDKGSSTVRPASTVETYGASTTNEQLPTDEHEGTSASGGVSIKPTIVIREVVGDLFSCPESWSLAHCISQDCRMGKGIAVMFKQRFDGVQELKKQNKRIGDVAVLKQPGGAVGVHRYIYYLITKETAWGKPTYGSLQQSLLATRDHCVSHGVRQLAMPRIGCGLDGLDWRRVRGIIGDVFADSKADIEITIYSFK